MVDLIKGCTEINQHDPSLLPTLQCTLQCMGCCNYFFAELTSSLSFHVQASLIKWLWQAHNGEIWLCSSNEKTKLLVYIFTSFDSIYQGIVDDFSYFYCWSPFRFCKLNFIILFPLIIKYYYIMFIIIVFWLGRDRPSGLFFCTHFASFPAQAYLLTLFVCFFHTLSGRIGKVVASHAEVARSIPSWAETALIYTMHEALRGYFSLWWGGGGGCSLSIGSTVSDAFVHRWLWSTATMSSPFGYFSRLLQVVDNWPRILWQSILHWEAPGHRRLYLYFTFVKNFTLLYHAQAFGKTLMQEFPFYYSHTDMK